MEIREDIIGTHPPGASEMIIDKRSGKAGRAPDIDRRRLSPFLRLVPTEAISVINDWMESTILLGMQKVWDELERQDKELVSGTDLKIFHRYERLLASGGKRVSDPADHIRRGIAVALRVVGSYYAHVNQAFQAREGRAITVAEAKQVLANSAQTIRVTAGMYVNTLNELDRLMWEYPGEEPLYAADSIVLVGQGEDLSLEPAPQLHTQLSKFPGAPGQRTGCPALAAKGSDGKSVIDGLLDWYRKMAYEFYFPGFTDFVKNAEILRKAGM